MKTLSAKPAFTFVEIVIVMLLVSIFSAGFAISYSNNQKKVTFDSDKEKVLSIIQKARNLSLTNLMIGTEQADYYQLVVSTSAATLTGVSIDGTSSVIETVTFSSGIEADSILSVKYIPPYGTVTFVSNAHAVTIHDEDSTNTSTITISEFGGFAEAT